MEDAPVGIQEVDSKQEMRENNEWWKEGRREEGEQGH